MGEVHFICPHPAGTRPDNPDLHPLPRLISGQPFRAHFRLSQRSRGRGFLRGFLRHGLLASFWGTGCPGFGFGGRLRPCGLPAPGRGDGLSRGRWGGAFLRHL